MGLDKSQIYVKIDLPLGCMETTATILAKEIQSKGV
jgi:hypothetical protein